MLKVKNVLISQPAPADFNNSPYKQLAAKYNLNLVFRKLFKIEGLTAREFRTQKIDLLDFTAVIFTSKNAVDHYFRIAQDLRIQIPPTMKYFCSSETTAYYIQNYAQFRKRKIFYAKQTNESFIELVCKHKEEKYLYLTTEDSSSELPKEMTKNKINYTKASVYKTVFEKISKDIQIKDFDLIVFFSPIGIKSLLDNYPDFKQENTLIAAFGHSAWHAVEDAGLTLHIPAPTKEATSMVQAISLFLGELQKKGGNLNDMLLKKDSPATKKKPAPTRLSDQGQNRVPDSGS